MSKPHISIITPCLNRAEFVSSAVESVLRQDYSPVEHIVVDGGSMDGTLEILSAYTHLRIVSEPDNGVYDALNKGIRLARGDVLGLLNSDDLYTPGVFFEVADLFAQNPDCSALLGGASIFSKAEEGSKHTLAVFPPYPPGAFLEQVTWGVPLFNAWFFRRQVFDDFGFFDTRYRYAADRDFLIRLALDCVPYISLDKNVYLYRQHAGSLTFNDQMTAESGMVHEFREIAEEYIQRGDLPPGARSCFQRWHSLITSHQVLFAIRSLEALRSVRYARKGMRYDPAWLWVFGREFAGSGARKLSAAISGSDKPYAANSY